MKNLSLLLLLLVLTGCDCGDAPPEAASGPCDAGRLQPTQKYYCIALDIFNDKTSQPDQYANVKEMFGDFFLPALQPCLEAREHNGQWLLYPFDLQVIPIHNDPGSAATLAEYRFDRKKFADICWQPDGPRQECQKIWNDFDRQLARASNPQNKFRVMLALVRLAEAAVGHAPADTRIVLCSDMLEDLSGQEEGFYSFTEIKENKTVISPSGVEAAQAALSRHDSWIHRQVLSPIGNKLRGHTLYVYRPRFQSPDPDPETGISYDRSVEVFWRSLMDSLGAKIEFREMKYIDDMEWD